MHEDVVRDALELVEELLKEIYEVSELTERERSIVGQLETIRGVLTLDGESDEEEEVETCWVRTAPGGEILVQYPDDNQWGFSLSDGELHWSGGFDTPRCVAWKKIEDDDSAITPKHREAMGWLFSEDHDDGTKPRKPWYERGIGGA